MVNDLFELSRVEGPMQLHLERVGADDLVEEALASADPVARAKGIRLVARTSPGLPVTVDPDEFGRVMRNLLLNAIRHTPNDGTIAVTAGVSENPDDAVSFTVADACGGIPEDDLPRVFETAFRGNAARTTGPDHGGGFGLAIARRHRRGAPRCHRASRTMAAVAASRSGCPGLGLKAVTTRRRTSIWNASAHAALASSQPRDGGQADVTTTSHGANGSQIRSTSSRVMPASASTNSESSDAVARVAGTSLRVDRQRPRPWPDPRAPRGSRSRRATE